MTPEQLKASILQYAMEGKLVKQDLKDKSASRNLSAARTELKKAILNKKIRKEKYCLAEKPNVFPQNWEVARLIEICKKENGAIRRGPFGSSITKSMFVPKIREAFKVYEQGNAIRKDSKYGNYYLPNSEFERLKSFAVKPGDVLISCAGTIGRTYVLPKKSERGIINQALLKLSIDETIMNKDFFLLVFENLTKKINNDAKGSAIKNLASLKYLKNKVVFPLPPLKEQKRIVAKIEQLLPLIDKYAEAYNRLKEIDDNFNDKMKQSILQYAMEGKLVTQDPTDELASELLKKIKAEKAQLVKDKKIKQDKKLPEITQEEIPFEIPESWEWTRLGNVSNYIQRGRSPQYSNTKTEHKVISQKCIQWEEISLEKAKYIDNTFFDKLENYRFVKKDDLLWCSTGTGTVGRINIVANEFNNTPVDSHVTIVRSNSYANSKFIFYFLISAHIQNNLNSLLTGSTKQKELGLSTIQHIVIPLPPLQEQKRIVAKIDFLFQKL